MFAQNIDDINSNSLIFMLDDSIVILDDNPVIFEYNSYQNKIRYPLKYNLKKGLHTLYVQASDKVGNKTIVKGNFHIK